MTLDQVKEKKITGDIATAARVLNISPANGRQALARPKSKYHDKLVYYLEQLIEAREKINSLK